jgi:hypothetical protein
MTTAPRAPLEPARGTEGYERSDPGAGLVPQQGGPPAGSTPSSSPAAVRDGAAGPFLGRLVLGLLLVVVGVGWFLDGLGVAVPWAMAPAAGAILVGVVLLLSPVRHGRTGPLVALGALLLVVGAVAGVPHTPSGPVGNRLLEPAAGDWPVTASVSAGTITVDLTRHPLPASGRLTAEVGAGNVVVLLPRTAAGRAVSVTAQVGAGSLRVDGREQRSGFAVDWSTGQGGPVAVTIDVGLGNVEVRHG